MGQTYSAPVGLRPVTDPISFTTCEALGVFTQRLGEQLAPERVILFVFPQDLDLRRPEGNACV
jgi:hypothetical protein